jgi:hypothetical protein
VRRRAEMTTERTADPKGENEVERHFIRIKISEADQLQPGGVQAVVPAFPADTFPVPSQCVHWISEESSRRRWPRLSHTGPLIVKFISHQRCS